MLTRVSRTCECGCGEPVTKGRRFRIGHNQRRNYKHDDGLDHRVRFYRRIKNKCIDAYGGKCVCCGESERLFLVFDHIDNDGSERRRLGLEPKTGREFYTWLIANNFPDHVQLLCANCNTAKHISGSVPCPAHEGF